MYLLQCETCNTLHRKWSMSLPVTRSISNGGSVTDRKNKTRMTHSCPLDPSHKCKQIIVHTADDTAFLARFIEISKEHKQKYKATRNKNILYLDLNQMTSQELIELRKAMTEVT